MKLKVKLRAPSSEDLTLGPVVKIWGMNFDKLG